MKEIMEETCEQVKKNVFRNKRQARNRVAAYGCDLDEDTGVASIPTCGEVPNWRIT